MKRVVLCSMIIVAIIVQSVVMLHTLKTSNNELFALIDEAVELAESKETDKALAKVQELSRFWKDYYIKISFLVQSSKLEDISFSVSKLEPLLEEDSEEFFSECRAIRYSAQLIYDSEFPHLYSVI